jgi:hypothetical protein
LARRERQLPTRTWVFLPAAGNRNGTSVNNVGSNGNYWSASYNNSNNAYNVNFNDSNLNTNNNNRYNGQSVRLVRVAENYSCVFFVETVHAPSLLCFSIHVDPRTIIP